MRPGSGISSSGRVCRARQAFVGSRLGLAGAIPRAAIGGLTMPKRRFTSKEDRQAGHIAASERKRGVPAKRAKSIGYAVVVKQKARRKKGKTK